MTATTTTPTEIVRAVIAKRNTATRAQIVTSAVAALRKSNVSTVLRLWAEAEVDTLIRLGARQVERSSVATLRRAEPPEVAAKREADDLRREEHIRSLWSKMTGYAGLAVLGAAFTSELLDQEFALGDGRRVTWRDASADEHNQRVQALTVMADGIWDTIDLHGRAAAILESMQAPNLGAIFG